MRRHSDLSARQLQRVSESTRVPCRPRSTRRGCGQPVGEPCVSLATGLPLSGLGAHVDRLLDAMEAGPALHRPSPRSSSAGDRSDEVLAGA